MKLLLEISPAETRLADDGQKCSDHDFFVIRDGDGNSPSVFFLLHNDVAATTTDFNETMSCKDGTDFFTGKNRQFRQR